MKSIFVFSIFLCYFDLLSKMPDKNTTVFILKDKSKQGLFFYYQDQFGHAKEYIINSKKDTLIMKLNNITPIRFADDNRQYPIFAYPGDTIYIQFSKEKSKKYEFYSRNAHELNFLNELEANKLGVGMLDLTGIIWHDEINTEIILEEHDRLYNARLKMLTIYSDSLKFRPEYHRLIKNEIELVHLLGLMQPFFNSSDQKKKELPEDYYKRLDNYKQWLTADTSLLSCYWYRFAFMSYHMYTNKGPCEPEVFFEKLYYSANDYPQPFSQVIQFNLLHDERESRTALFLKYLDDFRKKSSNKEYIDHLNQEIKELESLTQSEDFTKTPLIGIDGKKYTWGGILKAHTGQVVYTDIWASWCGPCRMEIPHSIKLQKQLPTSTYTFVYISVDTDKKKWLAAINSSHLAGVKKKHYMLNPESNLAKRLAPDGIPRYLLFNKNGKVITLNAPRPSSPETLDLLTNAAKY